MSRKLYKSRYDVKFDGVCAGIAAYLGLDATLVRLAWILFTLLGGSGIILYIICMLLMPRESKIKDVVEAEAYDEPREN